MMDIANNGQTSNYSYFLVAAISALKLRKRMSKTRDIAVEQANQNVGAKSKGPRDPTKWNDFAHVIPEEVLEVQIHTLALSICQFLCKEQSQHDVGINVTSFKLVIPATLKLWKWYSRLFKPKGEHLVFTSDTIEGIVAIKSVALLCSVIRANPRHHLSKDVALTLVRSLCSPLPFSLMSHLLLYLLVGMCYCFARPCSSRTASYGVSLYFRVYGRGQTNPFFFPYIPNNSSLTFS